MDVLEIEWDWSVFRLSDGQRRRVQLLLGLARQSELLLLGEPRQEPRQNACLVSGLTLCLAVCNDRRGDDGPRCGVAGQPAQFPEGGERAARRDANLRHAHFRWAGKLGDRCRLPDKREN